MLARISKTMFKRRGVNAPKFKGNAFTSSSSSVMFAVDFLQKSFVRLRKFYSWFAMLKKIMDGW